MSEGVRIRDISGKPGTTQRGLVTIGETPTGPINVPVVIISGKRPGPTLCLTAGVHATEYPGMDAVMRLSHELRPEDISGVVIAVPVVNTVMFGARSGFLNPIDGQNLNRVAPGRPDGTLSEVLAHVLLNEIIGIADYHLDCHGGDLPEALLPYAAYNLTGDAAMDEKGEAICRIYSPRVFALYKDGGPLPPITGSVTYQATRRGVVSVLTETGSAGRLDPADVQYRIRRVIDIMRYLKMLDGEPQVASGQLQAVTQFRVTARRGGLIRTDVKVGDELKAGQLLAEVVNVFGDVVERIEAPRDGIARIVWTHRVVNTGDSIVLCWVAEPAPPFPSLAAYTKP